jgi:hypothetical protein
MPIKAKKHKPIHKSTILPDLASTKEDDRLTITATNP